MKCYCECFLLDDEEGCDFVFKNNIKLEKTLNIVSERNKLINQYEINLKQLKKEHL